MLTYTFSVWAWIVFIIVFWVAFITDVKGLFDWLVDVWQ